MKTTTLLLIVLAASDCRAQPPTAPPQSSAPAFEVASVHLGTEESLRYDGARMQADHGSLTTHSLPLRACIQWAYQIPPTQVIGPDWLNNVRLDIVAKTAAPVSDQQLFLMLRTLLADRLGVKVHVERREMPVYILTVGKGGPKFSESTSEGPPNVERGREVEIHQRMSMYELFAETSNAVGRPIVNATGLNGLYDFQLKTRPMITNVQNGMDKGSALLIELEDQLGLKAEARKDWVDVLVIDHAEKTPTEN
jgi:uncharacterized protein (TIGR03435 family)